VHPFVTLFTLFIFGNLLGFVGIVLAVPLVLLVWTTKEVLWWRARSRPTETTPNPLSENDLDPSLHGSHRPAP
jgi:predicted PurR-regulated permease PerM